MNKAQKIADLQVRKYDWPICWDAVELIAQREDCFLTAYLCPAKVWTIGWGETVGVTRGMNWTKEQADARFFESIKQTAQAVKEMCTGYTNEDQAGALTSLAYNIGLTALKNSTVLRTHNAGDVAAASRAFHLWNKARVNGKLAPLAGLTARRAAESALYLRQEPSPFPEPSVQAVAEESNIITRPINVAGAGAASVGAVPLAQGFLGDTMPIVEKARDFADTIGMNLPAVLGALAVGCGIYIIYSRFKQRSGGWA